MGGQIWCDHPHVSILKQAFQPAPVDWTSPKAVDQHRSTDEPAGLGEAPSDGTVLQAIKSMVAGCWRVVLPTRRYWRS
jgi:hypothetical protein